MADLSQHSDAEIERRIKNINDLLANPYLVSERDTLTSRLNPLLAEKQKREVARKARQEIVTFRGVFTQIDTDPDGVEREVLSTIGVVTAEHRIWDPTACLLSAAVIGGVRDFGFGRGSRVLYLANANSTNTISHVSDILGSNGSLYVIVLPTGKDEIVAMAGPRPNITIIDENAVHAKIYQDEVVGGGRVDVIISDDQRHVEVDDPTGIKLQCAMLSKNVELCLKSRGRFVAMFHASPTFCHQHLKELQMHNIKASQSVDLEEFHPNSSCVTGQYLL